LNQADDFSRLVTAATGRVAGRVIHTDEIWMTAKTVYGVLALVEKGTIEP
jgi:hypothetical protein